MVKLDNGRLPAQTYGFFAASREAMTSWRPSRRCPSSWEAFQVALTRIRLMSKSGPESSCSCVTWLASVTALESDTHSQRRNGLVTSKSPLKPSLNYVRVGECIRMLPYIQLLCPLFKGKLCISAGKHQIFEPFKGLLAKCLSLMIRHFSSYLRPMLVT
jgi:hypothetical protein